MLTLHDFSVAVKFTNCDRTPPHFEINFASREKKLFDNNGPQTYLWRQKIMKKNLNHNQINHIRSSRNNLRYEQKSIIFEAAVTIYGTSSIDRLCLLLSQPGALLFFFFHPIYLGVLSSPFCSLPPRRNSVPGSHSRLFFPPTTQYGSCLAFLVARRFQLFLA